MCPVDGAERNNNALGRPFGAPDTTLTERLETLHSYARVGQCVNGVTHDVNNQLGAILAYAELISYSGPIDPDTKGMLDKVIACVERCTVLVGDLTRVARPPAERIGEVNVRELIEAVVRLREYAMKVALITHEVHVGDDVPVLRGDLAKLQHALLALLLNAEDAAGERGRIRVSALCDGENVLVRVWNSGVSFGDADWEVALQRWTTAKTGHHIGLGLPAAKATAEAHDGTLTWSPDAGVTLSLPAIR